MLDCLVGMADLSISICDGLAMDPMVTAIKFFCTLSNSESVQCNLLFVDES